MLEGLVHRKQDRARLEASPAREHLAPFATALLAKRYRHRTVVRYLFSADRLARWLRRRGQTMQQMDEPAYAEYLLEMGRRRRGGLPNGRLPTTAAGARGFFVFPRESGVTRAPIFAPATEAERWLASYDHHLEYAAGLSPGTRRHYCRFAHLLIAESFGGQPLDWTALTADGLTEFVRRVAADLKPSGSCLPVTAVRAFIRFLVSRGAVRSGLEGAVPTVRQWKHASLPKALSAEEVQRVLSLCQSGTDVVIRDRAVLVLLARLGLRAGEVAALEVEHIRWSEGELLVIPGKSGRERLLPLSDEVGHALVAYLRRRPQSNDRRVFRCALAPHRPLAASSVSAIARRYLRRAGLPTGYCGAHALRHTVATQMVQRGVSFKQVADVLGHARLETTAIYAKLDLETLSRLAPPFPGGEP
jgi:site-specific recombinase XerD